MPVIFKASLSDASKPASSKPLLGPLLGPWGWIGPDKAWAPWIMVFIYTYIKEHLMSITLHYHCGPPYHAIIWRSHVPFSCERLLEKLPFPSTNQLPRWPSKFGEVKWLYCSGNILTPKCWISQKWFLRNFKMDVGSLSKK
jgi:hypothetical protein